MSKNIMINILKDIELYPELAKAFGSLTDEQKSKFLTAMRSMNRGMLYSSPIHGEYHSEKVTLFCVLLGVKLGCTNNELDILIDAGRYHDFMRESDCEDSFHGLGAANNIERVIPRGKYTPGELNLLKSIMDYHSTDIRLHDYDVIAENHDVDSKDIEMAFNCHPYYVNCQEYKDPSDETWKRFEEYFIPEVEKGDLDASSRREIAVALYISSL